MRARALMFFKAACCLIAVWILLAIAASGALLGSRHSIEDAVVLLLLLKLLFACIVYLLLLSASSYKRADYMSPLRYGDVDVKRLKILKQAIGATDDVRFPGLSETLKSMINTWRTRCARKASLCAKPPDRQ